MSTVKNGPFCPLPRFRLHFGDDGVGAIGNPVLKQGITDGDQETFSFFFQIKKEANPKKTKKKRNVNVDTMQKRSKKWRLPFAANRTLAASENIPRC